MGLYLCIFENEEDVDGVDVGSYGDYNHLRNTIVQVFEGGEAGSRCPVLTLHSDCDGTWTPEECMRLEKEVLAVIDVFKQRPAIPFHSPWQAEVAKGIGLRPANLYESFIDVDGEPLLDRLLKLTRAAQHRNAPITFQ